MLINLAGKEFPQRVLLNIKPYSQPCKHFNVGSVLLLGWYDVATSHNVKSTLKQRCVCQRWNLQRRTTLKQRCVFQRWTEQRWTTSKQRCHFQRRFSQCWATSKQRCEYDHFKKMKPRFKSKIIFVSFMDNFDWVLLNFALYPRVFCAHQCAKRFMT